MHCVLRWRGGGSAVPSVDSGDGGDVDSCSDASSGIGAAGSGVLGGQCTFSDGSRAGRRSLGRRRPVHGDVHPRVGSAVPEGGSDAGGGVSCVTLAKEEGAMNDGVRRCFPIFIEEASSRRSSVHDYIEEQERLYDSILGRARRRPVPPQQVIAPCPCVVEREPDYRVILYEPFPDPSRKVPSASGVSISRTVGVSQGSGQGQSVVVGDGALSAPICESRDVDVAKEERDGYPKELLTVRRGLGPEDHGGLCRRLSSELEPVARRQSSSPEPAPDCSAWCKPSVRRLDEGGEPPSIEVDFANTGRSPDEIQLDDKPLSEIEEEHRRIQFDEILVQCYGYPPRWVGNVCP